MRGLTRVQDKFKSPEEFAEAVKILVGSHDFEAGPILPARCAVQLGVPEVSLRAVIGEEGWGDTVELLYMESLASCLEWVFRGDTKVNQVMLAVLRDMFGWFSGISEYLVASTSVEAGAAGDNLVLNELLERVKRGLAD